MKLRIGLAPLMGLALVTLPHYALADGHSNSDWYAAGNLGLSILDESDFSDEVSGVGSGQGDIDFDNGIAVTAAVGKSFGNLRAEAEFSYRAHDLDTLTLSTATIGGQTFLGNASATLGGDITSIGLMGNAYYDFDLGNEWTPFLIGGVGIVRHTLDVSDVAGTATDYDESDTVFAYQFGAGVGYQINDLTDLTAQYRFVGSADPTFDDGTDRISGEFHSHSIMVGLTRTF